MATLEEAEAARLAHQDRFGAMGAHAIGIYPMVDGTGYELVVQFAQTPPDDVPRSVVVTNAGRTVTVPVRTKTKAE
jgi:hypothetical protein